MMLQMCIWMGSSCGEEEKSSTDSMLNVKWLPPHFSSQRKC